MDRRALIASLAEEYDSFYLYDEQVILDSAACLRAAFPQVAFLYSVKCNPDANVLRCIFGQGFGADAASAGEVAMARELGLAPERIYYSAPGKTAQDIDAALDGAVLIADSLGELARIQAAAEQRGRTVEIGLRVNPDFSFTGGAAAPSKFGIDEAQALALAADNPYKNLRVTGIHVHLKSQELDAEALARYHENMFRLAETFARAFGELDYVNMGSGIGVPYEPDEAPMDLAALSAAFNARLADFRAAHPGTKVFIETGRYVTCKCGTYVTKVLDRKVSRGKTYIILKSTMNGFIRPSLARLGRCYLPDGKAVAAEPLYTSKNAFELVWLKDGPATETVTLVGNLCTATDAIADDVAAPHPEPGDLLAITNAGSYAAVLTPFQFSSQERPRAIFLTRDGQTAVSQA